MYDSFYLLATGGPHLQSSCEWPVREDAIGRHAGRNRKMEIRQKKVSTVWIWVPDWPGILWPTSESGVKFTNIKTLLFYFLTATFPMKNSASIENCDRRALWISTQNTRLVQYFNGLYLTQRSECQSCKSSICIPTKLEISACHSDPLNHVRAKCWWC